MSVKSTVFAAGLAVAGVPEHGGDAALNAHYGIEKAAQVEFCAARQRRRPMRP